MYRGGMLLGSGTSGGGGAVRTVVADDSVLLREGLVRLLQEGGVEVVGQAGDADELVRKTRLHKPDIVVVDARMPSSHTSEGVDAARLLRRENPSLAVLVLSQYVELISADLLAHGVNGFGYLMKDRVVNVAEFLEAFRRVAAGGSAIDPEVVAQMLGRNLRGHLLDDLTRREVQTLELMAEGWSNDAIGEKMHVTRSSVEKYVGAIFLKLDIPEGRENNRRVLAVVKFVRRRAETLTASPASTASGFSYEAAG